jgi:hypothetical protein
VQSLIDQGIDCRKGRWPSMARMNLLPKDLAQSIGAIAEAIRVAEKHSLD